MMSDQVELTNPVDTSVGGMKGHILRRTVHIGMCAIPFVYFSWGENVSSKLDMELQQIVASVILIALVAESIRLKFGITIFGQRDYEAKQISALAWGAFGIGMVLLLAPHEAYAYPLILSLALGDPLMGELRRKGIESRKVMIYSTILILAIWLACSVQFDTPVVASFILAPVCMISEWPRLRYIDDNATMLLIPLSLILILEPFFKVMV
ncbi:MAG: hypothetical protein CMA10_02325 [Euryarchaeota archaeon]|nr:hypothetical protein [Euryarchaeota archaeon]